MPWHLYSYHFQILTPTWPCYIRNTVRNTRKTTLCWMRGKINEFLFIKGTVFMPFSFRKKISTKHNIIFTEIAYQFSAPKVPVSRGNIATNSRTSTDLFQLQRKSHVFGNLFKLVRFVITFARAASLPLGIMRRLRRLSYLLHLHPWVANFLCECDDKPKKLE